MDFGGIGIFRALIGDPPSRYIEKRRLSSAAADLISSNKCLIIIVEKAKSLGAAIAGVASVESLRESPSHRIYPKIGMNLEVHWRDAKDDVKTDEVAWPADAVSAVVIGVAHNADEPELDWWDGKGTPGNRILVRINKKLSEWIENTISVKTYKLPYFLEKGGIMFKEYYIVVMQFGLKPLIAANVQYSCNPTTVNVS